jgi:hypothetical protein
MKKKGERDVANDWRENRRDRREGKKEENGVDT